MSFNLNFHREHEPFDYDKTYPYTVEHADYDAAASCIGKAYTTAKITSGISCVTLYIEYGERLTLCPAPVASTIKPDDELEIEVNAELVGAK